MNQADIDPEELGNVAANLTQTGAQLRASWLADRAEIDANTAGIGGYDILSSAFRAGYTDEVVTKTREIADTVPERFLQLGEVGRLAAQEHREHQDRATQSMPR